MVHRVERGVVVNDDEARGAGARCRGLGGLPARRQRATARLLLGRARALVRLVQEAGRSCRGPGGREAQADSGRPPGREHSQARTPEQETGCVRAYGESRQASARPRASRWVVDVPRARRGGCMRWRPANYKRRLGVSKLDAFRGEQPQAAGAWQALDTAACSAHCEPDFRPPPLAAMVCVCEGRPRGRPLQLYGRVLDRLAMNSPPASEERDEIGGSTQAVHPAWTGRWHPGCAPLHDRGRGSGERWKIADEMLWLR